MLSKLRDKVEVRLDRLLDRADDAVESVLYSVEQVIEMYQDFRRSAALLAARNRARAGLDRTNVYEHATRVRLLHMWAGLEDALAAANMQRSDVEPLPSSSARVLRVLAEIERHRAGSPWRTPRPRVGSDIERVASAELDKLCGATDKEEREEAAAEFHTAVHSLVGCDAANLAELIYVRRY